MRHSSSSRVVSGAALVAVVGDAEMVAPASSVGCDVCAVWKDSSCSCRFPCSLVCVIATSIAAVGVLGTHGVIDARLSSCAQSVMVCALWHDDDLTLRIY